MINSRDNTGFTLIELVIVIIIISVLAILVVPRITTTRADAEASICVGNIHTLNSAQAMYAAQTGSPATGNTAVQTLVTAEYINNVRCPGEPPENVNDASYILDSTDKTDMTFKCKNHSESHIPK